MNKKQKILFIYAAILLILFVLWYIFDGISVHAYKVTRQDAVKGVAVTGTVKSTEDTLVTSGIIGVIEKFYIKEGDYVEKNQLIATLIRKEQIGDLESAHGRLDTAFWELEDLLTEPRYQEVEIAKEQVDVAREKIAALKYTLNRNKVDLEDAKIDEERFRQLEKAGAVSKREREQKTLRRRELLATIGEISKQIEQGYSELNQQSQNLSLTINKIKIQTINAAKGKLKSAMGDNKAAEAVLENYLVTAPISGIITKRLLHTGDTISPTSPIVRIIVPDLIYLGMEVEENQIEFIKRGQKALAVFDAYPNKVFNCYVRDIVKQVNPATGTFEVKLTQPSEKIKIDVGMTVDASIITGEYKNAIIIPTEFIVQTDKGSYVYKKIGFWAWKTYVITENFDNNRTKITSGLNNGDVILKGVEKNKLKNNVHIKIADYYKL